MEKNAKQKQQEEELLPLLYIYIHMYLQFLFLLVVVAYPGMKKSIFGANFTIRSHFFLGCFLLAL